MERTNDTIRLIKIEPHQSNIMYRDAEQSYREVYNFSMAKGKGTLEPKSLFGNPIQLYPGNMSSLFKTTEKTTGDKLSYAEYLVSTKANGLRFMLLIGNKTVEGSRNIYLVDDRLNFWYIPGLPAIPKHLNVDKCLIDGELLFWGSVKTRIVNKDIKEYIISKTTVKPLIGFLAFDILYGPINPDYIREKESEITSHPVTFQLGNSGAMLGPKATGRWPTGRRRHVLEEMFLNIDSPLWNFLHKQTDMSTLNKVEYGIQGKQTIVKNQSSFNFMVFVSPFIKMDELLEKHPKDTYKVMIDILHNDIRSQYFYITYDHKKVMMQASAHSYGQET